MKQKIEKSKIEKELEFIKRNQFSSEQLKIIDKLINIGRKQSSQSKEKEMLDKFEKLIDEMKYCIKTGVHICNKHPEDCDNVINVDEIKERLQKLKGDEK